MNGGRAFFDTDILLYVYNGADQRKRALDIDLFRRHVRQNGHCLSTQVFTSSM